MNSSDKNKKPSREAQKLALESSIALDAALKGISSQQKLIELTLRKQSIKVPTSSLRLLSQILQATAQGKPISVVPVDSEITTQSAADYLGCSRPHLVKLLEEGEIPYTTTGKHRRVKYEDLQRYQQLKKAAQKKLLIEMMREDEKYKMYDS